VFLQANLAALALCAAALIVAGCGKSESTSSTVATTTATTSSAATSTPSSTSTSDAGSSALPPEAPVKVATGTPLTSAQLIAQGDAICQRANKLVDTVDVSNRSEIYGSFARAEVYEAAEASELAKLVPPASMAHDWEQIISGFHRYVEYAKVVARDAQAKNLKALGVLIKPAEAVHERLNAIALHDGFKYCSTIK